MKANLIFQNAAINLILDSECLETQNLMLNEWQPSYKFLIVFLKELGTDSLIRLY